MVYTFAFRKNTAGGPSGRDGRCRPKVLKKCTLPLTASHKVTYVVTELCVLHQTEAGLVLEELAPGVTVEDVLARTEAELIIPEKIGCMA